MKITLLTASGLALALLGVAHAGASKPTAQLKAEATASKKMHAKLVSSKYEFEDGRWQYAVLVKKGVTLYEVEVSKDGTKVLDSEKTSAAEEAKEAAADKKAAANKKSGQKAATGDTEKDGAGKG